MAGEYPHIDTIWKRNERGLIIPVEFSTPEFCYLQHNRWLGTEKVNGTNIRVMWDPDEPNIVKFGGKADNSQISAFLITKLQKLFPVQALAAQFPEGVCLYGEGHGARIQKGGGNYIGDDVDFVLFDVMVGRWWLKRDAIDSIAATLGIQAVPIVFSGSLLAACGMVEAGFQSQWGEFQAEGLVLKPEVDLLKRDGSRVITKIKHIDYERMKRSKG